MLQAFNKARLFLEDHSKQLEEVITVKPLVALIKEYYYSELLFENHLFAFHGRGADFEEMSNMILQDTNCAVLAWARSMLDSQTKLVCRMSAMPIEQWEALPVLDRLASGISRTMEVPDACVRPKCWYEGRCKCGWPLCSQNTISWNDVS